MWAVAVGAAEAHPGRWLVVTAPAFRTVLAPLMDHRRAEGFQVEIIQTTDLLTPDQIRRGDSTPLQTRVWEFCRAKDTPSFILLAGTATASHPSDPSNAEQTVVPSLLGTVERMKGQPSDYRFAPPLEPGSPPVAVGRFPARTVEEMNAMVGKTLKLERDPAPGSWRNRVVLLLGNPGGGPIAELVANGSLTHRLPLIDPAWNIRAISCSAASRYYLTPKYAHDAFIRALEEGTLFSIFMGHSSADGMWLGEDAFFTRNDWTGVTMPGPGIFFTCGCFALNSQKSNGHGYGLTASRMINGPAAVIGATAESYAAPGLLAADGLLRCFSRMPFRTRLADFWLSIQAGLATGEIDPVTFNLYDQVDGSKGRVPLAAQRLEHLEMWMLLGDPALQLPVPANLPLETAGTLTAGKRVTVKGTLPSEIGQAIVHVTLERPLASTPNDLNLMAIPIPRGVSPRDAGMISNFEQANHFVLTEADTDSNAGTFHCVLEVPSSIPWSNVIVRAEVTAPGQSAMGVLEVPVSRSRSSSSSP